MSTINRLVESRNHLFITGGAGVGKSHTLKALIQAYLDEGKKVAKLASTGIAATHIGGQTLHSFFKIGTANSVEILKEKSLLNAPKALKNLISTLDLIVIDEISMVSSGVFEIIWLRLEQGGFEGKLVVAGDFLQLSPIIKRDDIQLFQKHYPLIPIETVFGYAFEAPAWELCQFETYWLEVNKRTDNHSFIRVLNDFRHGHFRAIHQRYMENFLKGVDETTNPTYLYAKNIDVKAQNLQALEKHSGDLYQYNAIINEGEKSISDDEIKRFLDEARVVEELQLKEGVPILFLRNSWNYYNGEKGVIKHLSHDAIHIQKSDGHFLKLEREKFSKMVFVEEKVDGETVLVEKERFSVEQFPITLAYALTIHKSQGMSLSEMVIEADGIFAPAQFYVALSRARDPYKVVIKTNNTNFKRFVYTDKKAVNFYHLIEPNSNKI
jgi:ATP-dependent exoDNAse (exonuclease V) alpha subunit